MPGYAVHDSTIAELARLILTTGSYVQAGGCSWIHAARKLQHRARSCGKRPTPVELAVPDKWVADRASGLLRSDAAQIDAIRIFAETVVAVAS